LFSYDPFTHIPKEQCTVGALRAQATDVDVRERAVTGAQPRDPNEPPITIMSIVAAATGGSSKEWAGAATRCSERPPTARPPEPRPDAPATGASGPTSSPTTASTSSTCTGRSTGAT